MTEHLTESRMAQYRRRRLSPSEWLVAAEHLAGCEECRLRLRSGEGATAVGTLLAAEVQGAWEEEAHLDYEEMAAYVDGTASEIVRATVDLHVQTCEACEEQLRE